MLESEINLCVEPFVQSLEASQAMDVQRSINSDSSLLNDCNRLMLHYRSVPGTGASNRPTLVAPPVDLLQRTCHLIHVAKNGSIAMTCNGVEYSPLDVVENYKHSPVCDKSIPDWPVKTTHSWLGFFHKPVFIKDRPKNSADFSFSFSLGVLLCLFSVAVFSSLGTEGVLKDMNPQDFSASTTRSQGFQNSGQFAGDTNNQMSFSGFGFMGPRSNWRDSAARTPDQTAFVSKSNSYADQPWFKQSKNAEPLPDDYSSATFAGNSSAIEQQTVLNSYMDNGHSFILQNSPANPYLINQGVVYIDGRSVCVPDTDMPPGKLVSLKGTPDTYEQNNVPASFFSPHSIFPPNTVRVINTGSY